MVMERGQRTRYPGIRRLADGRYVVRAVGKDARTGRRKEASKIVEGTISKARKALEALRGELQAGGVIGSRERTTLAAYARSWAAERAPHLAASTRERYWVALDGHILPELGPLYVDAITRRDVADWVTAQAEAGYAPATINGRLRVLRTVLADACDEACCANPAARVAALPEPAQENELTEAEAAAVLEAARAKHPRWYPLVATLAYTGLRFGEASALRWEDLDREAGIIRVRRAHYRGEVKETKTKRERVVPLAPELAAVLAEWRGELLRRQHPGLQAGWCFPARKGRAGSWLHRSSGVLSKPLAECLEAAGIERRVTAQGFRRAAEDMLRRLGVSGALAEAVMGHNARMRERYSTVAPAEVAALGPRIAARLSGSGGTCGGT